MKLRVTGYFSRLGNGPCNSSLDSVLDDRFTGSSKCGLAYDEIEGRPAELKARWSVEDFWKE